VPDSVLPVDTWIALLGRRDRPVDGVEDYCTFLASALARQNVALRLVHVDWDRLGWLAALLRLSGDARMWRGCWVLLQYTALGWSRRGFPWGALFAARVLKWRGVRLAIVFHEPERQRSGSRLVDRIRGALQDWIISRLFARAERAVFADALEAISWLPRDRAKAVFIPIGANIPEPPIAPEAESAFQSARPEITIAVYCLSTLPNRARELSDISRAVEFAAASAPATPLRVIFFGRGTDEASDEIHSAFAAGKIRVEVRGILGAGAISTALAHSDILLAVRGPLFPRRGSVIAGIACGLPIVAYSNGRSAFPLSEAGIELAPWHEPQELAGALERVVRNPAYRQALREKSRRAYEQYMSWDAIAKSLRRAFYSNAGTE
jgi:glycosyltransferase involved in cell wall biosynthesis